jgi:starch synthase
MNVLFAASEAAPFAKTGGLADVIGSLPKELKKQGIDVRVILPKYADMPEMWKARLTDVESFTVRLGWREQYCGIQQLEHEGVTFYFVDNEWYFGRPGLYGYGDDAERFGFFSKAVLEALPRLGFKPDWIHCHDWQTGMIPVLLKAQFQLGEWYQGILTMMTIHNLKYQGVFATERMKDLFLLGDEYFSGTTLEQHGGGSFLKGGLQFADVLTTVSRSYAEEIQTAYFGEYLDGLLRHRSGDLHGIVNGIDYESFDPMTDPHLEVNYRDSLPKKLQSKLKLQEELGLPQDGDVPVISMVTRLVQQKGLDLVRHVISELLSMDVQFVILGTGEHEYEELFRWAAREYPNKLSAQIRFDDGLSRRVYAGSDLFLMPSQFEPCGIGQLIALRYRTVPIVRETGGLRDTVQPYNEFTGDGTGFTFANYNAHDMLHTVRRAVYFYRNDRDAWAQLHKNIKKLDFSWRKSAQQYIGLYRSRSSIEQPRFEAAAALSE